jgi:hypothetical protein
MIPLNDRLCPKSPSRLGNLPFENNKCTGPRMSQKTKVQIRSLKAEIANLKEIIVQLTKDHEFRVSELLHQICFFTLD